MITDKVKAANQNFTSNTAIVIGLAVFSYLPSHAANQNTATVIGLAVFL